MATQPGTNPGRARFARGRNNLDLESRVIKLENDMSDHVIPSLKNIDEQLATVVGVLTASNTVIDYAKKYGAKTITFGAGVMTAAGFGNPKVLAFIVSFFS